METLYIIDMEVTEQKRKMHAQKKFHITNEKMDRIASHLRGKGGHFKRSTVTRDLIFLPDSRAYLDSFISRFSLMNVPKGLFLRVREENDLTTAGKNTQDVGLLAFRSEDGLMIEDHIHIGLDYTRHSLTELLHFFQLLGIDKVLEVTKKRDEYEITSSKRSMIVTLDQIESLDSPYLELHAFIEKNELPQLREEFDTLARRLLLVHETTVSSTYAQLLLQQKQTL